MYMSEQEHTDMHTAQQRIQKSGRILSQLIQTKDTLWKRISIDDIKFNFKIYSFYRCIGSMLIYTFDNMKHQATDNLLKTLNYSMTHSSDTINDWFYKKKSGYTQALAVFNELRG